MNPDELRRGEEFREDVEHLIELGLVTIEPAPDGSLALKLTASGARVVLRAVAEQVIH